MAKCECNYHLGMGPNLLCPVHGILREMGVCYRCGVKRGCECTPEEVADVVGQLGSALKTARKLREFAGGLNGLDGTLRAECTKLEQAIAALTEAGESVERKMLGKGREPITERVDAAHVEKVKAAKAEAEVMA